MVYRLLAGFQELFEGKPFLHRRPNQGDTLAALFYEDLYGLGRSNSLVRGVDDHRLAINSGNKITGKPARRGDGTFGELVPNVTAIVIPGYKIARGPVANLEIGAETKIFNTALRKQQQERVGDLNDQAAEFTKHRKEAIRVAIVGVNHAPQYTAYDGDKTTITDGRKYRHPAQEADGMVLALSRSVMPQYDEFLLLKYRASNSSPYDFAWIDGRSTHQEYGAALLRLSDLYQRRFG